MFYKRLNWKSQFKKVSRGGQCNQGRVIVWGVLGWLCLFSAGSKAVLAQASFQGLGDLPGGSFYTVALGVSSDGSVVVGFSSSTSGFEAFRWTSGGGMVGLGDLPGGTFGSQASAVSSDGSVVVGVSVSATGSEAFRWTSGGGMVGLGDLPGGDFGSTASAVSSDGSVVVGYGSSDLGREAFRWTSGGGMVGLGDLAGNIFLSNATAVSSDGSVVVGVGMSASGQESFRWVDLNNNGFVDPNEKLEQHPEFGLGDLPGGIFHSLANGVSSDGSVVVGTGWPIIGREAFRWTSGGGMVSLGDLPGGINRSQAYAISSNGAAVVGTGWPILGEEASIWDQTTNMRSLREVLINDYDLDLTGWTLMSALGVSADGRIIIGHGINPGGITEGWVATLSQPTYLYTLSVHWLESGCEALAGSLSWCGGADLNHDKIVNLLDLVIILNP